MYGMGRAQRPKWQAASPLPPAPAVRALSTSGTAQRREANDASVSLLVLQRGIDRLECCIAVHHRQRTQQASLLID